MSAALLTSCVAEPVNGQEEAEDEERLPGRRQAVEHPEHPEPDQAGDEDGPAPVAVGQHPDDRGHDDAGERPGGHEEPGAGIRAVEGVEDVGDGRHHEGVGQDPGDRDAEDEDEQPWGRGGRGALGRGCRGRGSDRRRGPGSNGREKRRGGRAMRACRAGSSRPFDGEGAARRVAVPLSGDTSAGEELGGGAVGVGDDPGEPRARDRLSHHHQVGCLRRIRSAR